MSIWNRKLLLEKNFESNTGACGGGSGDFSGYQMGFHGGGKGDFHGDFLADGKVLAGFDKRTAGADIGNRRFEIAIAGLTMGGRQNLGESFTPVISCFDIF